MREATRTRRRQRSEAIEELRLIPNSRSDLLAEACGLVLGGYLALVGSQQTGLLQAAVVLAEAGADPRLVAGFADQAAEQRAREPPHDRWRRGPANA